MMRKRIISGFGKSGFESKRPLLTREVIQEKILPLFNISLMSQSLLLFLSILVLERKGLLKIVIFE
jgi:hypothetical protein